ncbi:nitroreductase family protein [Gorillibacterium sp. CAU 1737]|uniref:nitroreductase family protein n=1 Tax=Gorillibacterium sp. CAU 1737 TaxID=3140362 RepID=UPI00325FE08E
MRIIQMSQELYASMDSRVSRRNFTAPPHQGQLAELRAYADELNAEAGGTIRFGIWEDGAEEVFGGLSNSYGMFKGVKAFMAFIGRMEGNPKQVKTLAGYYGEQLVLKANRMGLGTCWVAGTFDKAMAKRVAGVEEPEQLLCVCPVGETPESLSLREKLLKGFSTTRRRKPLEDIVRNADRFVEAPGWMRSALEAARIAPSALNAQPWRFHLQPEEQAIQVTVEGRASKEPVDLGIAMAHLEIAALAAGKRGTWTEEGESWTFRVTGEAL